MRAAIAVMLLAVTAPAIAADRAPQSCFFTTQFVSWKAADAKTIYISVRPQHIYRLDLSGACPMLLTANSHLITRFRSSSICSAIDWDLKVALGVGEPVEPCIVRTMTELSPSEAAALPKQYKPAF